ncbi:MAG: hypothetical protein PWP24_1167 [Clostridiales bacterium]|nr:hypothetical protein [Clostridiales bacterium]
MDRGAKNASQQRFFVLWLGEWISAIGSGLTSFGLGVYVFQKTGSASAMALVTLFAFLPSLLFSAPAGVFADRYDRRLLMVLGDSLSALGLLYILICMWRGGAALWQICLGVTISSVFSSLLEPSYKATISDLLTKEDYSRASGMIQIAYSSKYLISPILAGLLLAIADIKLLLLLDISTFIVTVITTLYVRGGIVSKKKEGYFSFWKEWGEGWHALTKKRGVVVLVFMGTLLTFFVAFIQTLCTPMVLSFADSKALGTMETLSALGMLVSSIGIGFLSIKKGYVRLLSLSLFLAGLAMICFGAYQNLYWITLSGFFFFLMLPFANTSLDFLLRTNLENEVQGRAFGLIGLISQLGYVVAYAFLGALADHIFTPMLQEGGLLFDTIGALIGVGSGRGSAFLIILGGFFLAIFSIILYQVPSVRQLEGEERYVLKNTAK